MSWLQAEQMMPDNFRHDQAQSYTEPVFYETGVPSCQSNEGVLVNKRCVPHNRRFTEVDQHPTFWQKQEAHSMPVCPPGCAPEQGGCRCPNQMAHLNRNEKYHLLLGLIIIVLICLVCAAGKQG